MNGLRRLQAGVGPFDGKGGHHFVMQFGDGAIQEYHQQDDEHHNDEGCEQLLVSRDRYQFVARTSNV